DLAKRQSQPLRSGNRSGRRYILYQPVGFESLARCCLSMERPPYSKTNSRRACLHPEILLRCLALAIAARQFDWYIQNCRPSQLERPRAETRHLKHEDYVLSERHKRPHADFLESPTRRGLRLNVYREW